MEAVKIDDSSFEVTKEAVVAEPVKQVYNIDFLKEQEVSILKSMNEQIAQRQTELDNVRALIAQAESLGLKTKAEIQEETIVIEEAKLEAITK